MDAAGPQRLRSVEMRSGSKQVYQIVVPTASDKRFEPQKVTEGAMPTAPGEIALPEALAERFGVGLGDEVTVERNVWTPDAAPRASTSRVPTADRRRTVDDLFGAYAQVGGAAVASPEDAAVGMPTPPGRTPSRRATTPSSSPSRRAPTSRPSARTS